MISSATHGKLQEVFVADDGRKTRSLFIKNLDLGFLEDNGEHPMKYIQELLDVFGTVCQLRLFNLLAAACVQFKSEDQASLVRQSSQGMPIGYVCCKNARSHHEH